MYDGHCTVHFSKKYALLVYGNICAAFKLDWLLTVRVSERERRKKLCKYFRLQVDWDRVAHIGSTRARADCRFVSFSFFVLSRTRWHADTALLIALIIRLAVFLMSRGGRPVVENKNSGINTLSASRDLHHLLGNSLTFIFSLDRFTTTKQNTSNSLHRNVSSQRKAQNSKKYNSFASECGRTS